MRSGMSYQILWAIVQHRAGAESNHRGRERSSTSGPTMIFRDPVPLRLEARDELCSLVDLERCHTAWSFQADGRGVRLADCVGSFAPGSPQLPRALPDDLGSRLDRVPGFPLDRRARNQNVDSATLCAGGRTYD